MSNSGDVLTMGGGQYVLTKAYEFGKMSNLEEFQDHNLWPRKEIINREQAFYLGASKSGGHSPFVLSETGLAIKAVLTPPELQHEAHGITKRHLESYSNELTEGERESAFPLPYVSGILTTKEDFKQLFGYWVISAKLPSARGCWPAFWLLLYGDSWPGDMSRLPEIDIMEAAADVLENKYHATAHSSERGGMVSTTDNIIDTGVDLVNEYHEYGLSWDADWLVWYFDGMEVKRVRTPVDMLDTPALAIINLAVGGAFDNEKVPGEWIGKPVPEDYAEPALFEVEYLRIYQEVAPSSPPEEAPVRGDVIATIPSGPLAGRTVTNADVNLLCELLIHLPQLLAQAGDVGK